MRKDYLWEHIGKTKEVFLTKTVMKIERFEDIKSWKKARKVTNTVYDFTDERPFAMDYGLKDQVRKSCVSIMSNIAEGFEREGNREFLNFLSIAKGSCAEACSQLYIAFDRGYISRNEFAKVKTELKEIGKLIGGFMSYLGQSDYKGSKFK